MANPRITLSAFADEIGPEPREQLDVLQQCGIRFVELRSIHKTNVLDLTEDQVGEFRKLLDARGMGVSAIGSPIGKIKLSEPWAPHLARFERAIELAMRFGTPNIRVFSFYPHDDGQPWSAHRRTVIDRLRQLTMRAAVYNLRLLHENEHRIYGEAPAMVEDLLATLESPHFCAVYDPANYVHGGHDPWEGWQRTKRWTVHLHIKDWVHGEEKARVAGEGQGRIAEVLADAAKDGYRGFATLEPHLLAGGPTGGVTGPDLFPKAVQALTAILQRLGIAYD
jgi:3-dehydroshikimate dehydratase